MQKEYHIPITKNKPNSKIKSKTLTSTVRSMKPISK